MELNKFKVVALPLRNKMLNVSLRLLEDRADAEDVVQDAFLKLWRMRGELDRYQSVEALAVTMAKRLSIDTLRRRRGEDAIGNRVEDANMQTPYRRLEEKEAADCIRKLIEQLPPLQRTIIRMKDVEGYEAAEIAEITGTTAEAVRVNLSRARKRVRERFLLLNRE